MAINDMKIRGILVCENGRQFTLAVENENNGMNEFHDCLLEDVDLYNRIIFDRKKLRGHFRKGAKVTVLGKLVEKAVTYHQSFTGTTKNVRKLFVSPERIFVREDGELYEV